jgi:hypothetical protein
MNTEIKTLAQQAQEASDECRGTISELLLRIEAGLPPDQLAMVKGALNTLTKRLSIKIEKGTEKIQPPPGGLLPA